MSRWCRWWVFGAGAGLVAGAWLAGMGVVGKRTEPEVAQHVESLRRMVIPDGVARPKVLLLGTFHFKDAGLDAYKPVHQFDVLSADGQAQVKEVLDGLARFAPTKIAVEVDAASQAKVDERYAAFRAGSAAPSANEITQIGFALAARLGHERVYAIDAQHAEPMPDPDVEASAKRLGQEAWLAGPMMPRYMSAIGALDELKTKVPLRLTLLVMNDPEVVRLSHGVYLTGGFRVGDGTDYAGADAFPTRWYSRNLRIFSNILRLCGAPEDRVLVVGGAGHVPILRHAAECSPDVDLVEVSEFLGINEASRQAP